MNHKEISKKEQLTVNCYVLTISDTRTKDNDTSGQYIKKKLIESKHIVSGHQILKDNAKLIEVELKKLIIKPIEAIILTGGTGISKKDQTFEVVDKIINKKLPGFGELFRFLSYKEIGSSALLSRATAGIAENSIIFSIPGSLSAVKLAMNKLIIPELEHIIWELNRQAVTEWEP